MSKSPDVYLELTLVAPRRLPRFLGGRTLAAYLADDRCQAAVERQLEVAGDALGRQLMSRRRMRRVSPNTSRSRSAGRW